jgi:hypothetical protein
MISYPRFEPKLGSKRVFLPTGFAIREVRQTATETEAVETDGRSVVLSRADYSFSQS